MVGSQEAGYPKRSPNEFSPGGWGTPCRPPPAPGGRDSQTPPSSHTHNRTRRDDATSPSGPGKKLSKLSARPPPLLNSAPAPRTDFPERLFRPRGLGLGPRRLGRGRGALGERAAYLPGLTLGLTARGWKAPRGLTSDPLSPARPSPRSPSPTRPQGENKLRAERRELRPPPRGVPAAARGFAPPTAPGGAGPEGTFFLRLPRPQECRSASRQEGWEPRLGTVRLGAGSGPKLLSESISGAPTVCFRLGGVEVGEWHCLEEK